MPALLEELQRLEVELHHPGVRCSRERLEELLLPQFWEVGRSGTQYTKATVVHYLLSQTVQPVVESSDFQVTLLAEGCALLTYRSWHREPGGSASNCALRSSVWLQSAAGWQLLYHQGTPCPGAA